MDYCAYTCRINYKTKGMKNENRNVVEVKMASNSPYTMEISIDTNGGIVMGEGFAKKLSQALAEILDGHEEISSKPDGLNEEDNAPELADRIFETVMRGLFSHNKEEAQRSAMDFLKILAEEGRLTEDEFPLFCNANSFSDMEEAGKEFEKLMLTSKYCKCVPETYPVAASAEGELVCEGCSKTVKT